MLGPALSRLLSMVFGYAYPAYECYKTVEHAAANTERLKWWCRYWILVSFITATDCRVISWLPLYEEAKLAFFVYLWHSKTNGTNYVYNSALRPFIRKHEAEIDRKLTELKRKCGEITALCWQQVVSYGKANFIEIVEDASSGTAQEGRPLLDTEHVTDRKMK